ncbi:hypothetical protein O181_103078 [Austropuccinia psidii MF-1]|uniref:Uncharacterized protein n=1 Tax=Austropuccinia psidii MF-1 TaxID=1389203 RepID=A0A9Q3JHI9_9BASI|nr:hypothetical protein [Austropuccinia psidii MF-1]
MGPLGPFWPKLDETKRGQRGSLSAHLSHFWPHNPTSPEIAKTTSGPQIGQEPQVAAFQFQGKTFPSSMHPVLKDPGVVHMWYNIPLCTIFFSNPMVTFSGPNYMIPNQVPNPSPFSKEDVSAIQSGNSLAPTRRPFEDPNHLALQELGCQFSSGLF